MSSRVIKNKKLVYELFDLLCEIENSADFCADIADDLDSEEDFHEMIDWLKENRGNVSYKDAMMQSVLIWQSHQPDDFFEPEEDEE